MTKINGTDLIHEIHNARFAAELTAGNEFDADEVTLVDCRAWAGGYIALTLSDVEIDADDVRAEIVNACDSVPSLADLAFDALYSLGRLAAMTRGVR